MKTSSRESATRRADVAMIECPGKCKAKFHPGFMKVCPYSGVLLGGTAAVAEVPPTGTAGGVAVPAVQKTPGGRWTKYLNRTTIVALLLLILAILAYFVYSWSRSGTGDIPPRLVLEEPGPARVLDLSGMAPIRTLPGRSVWIDEFEVLVGEYTEITNKVPNLPAGFSREHPVVNVSYSDAVEFAALVGKRLCTEQEWLAAVGSKREFSRAVTGRRAFAGGRDLPQDRNYMLDRSDIGVFNMLGNVSEWIEGSANAPQYIGDSWRDRGADQSGRLKPVSAPGGAASPTIGFRCCADHEVGSTPAGASGAN